MCRRVSGKEATYFYAGKPPRLYFVFANGLSWRAEDLVTEQVPAEKLHCHLGGDRDELDLIAHFDYHPTENQVLRRHAA